MKDLLNKAKAALILDQPFFASLLLTMPISEDTSIPTMATDGESIICNPNWVKSLTVSELTFVLAHEVMHSIFEHMFRRGERDHGLFNIAADYVINDLLVADKVGTMPNGGLYNPALVVQGKGTTEGVYDLLPIPPKGKGPGPGEPGGALDQVLDSKLDAAAKSEKQAEMKVKVIQAANAAKICGKLSAGLQRLVGDVTKPKTDWKSILRRFLSERAKIDWTYSKPKRRFLAEDLYLPGLDGQTMGEIVIAIDCSGSICEKILAEFTAEIKSIIQDVTPKTTHIIYFDSEVLKTDSYSPDDHLDIKPIGGGGTAFSPIFKEIERQGFNATACVVLTDLYCSDFGDAPHYPVLWASNGDDKAPWGEVMRLKE